MYGDWQTSWGKGCGRIVFGMDQRTNSYLNKIFDVLNLLFSLFIFGHWNYFGWNICPFTIFFEKKTNFSSEKYSCGQRARVFGFLAVQIFPNPNSNNRCYAVHLGQSFLAFSLKNLVCFVRKKNLHSKKKMFTLTAFLTGVLRVAPAGVASSSWSTWNRAPKTFIATTYAIKAKNSLIRSWFFKNKTTRQVHWAA